MERPDVDTGQEGTVRRACDRCRTRKVGCDRGNPCSNCRNVRLSCTYGNHAAKSKDIKQRVLISREYERKIDSIAESLQRIELQLESKSDANKPSREGVFNTPRLTGTSLRSRQTSSNADTRSSNTPSASSWAGNTATDIPPPTSLAVFEGSSSLTANSLLAIEFLQKALSGDILESFSRDLADMITALRRAVDMQKMQPDDDTHDGAPEQHAEGSSSDINAAANTTASITAGESNDKNYNCSGKGPLDFLVSDLPPVESTLQVLQWAREFRGSCLFWLCDVMPVERLLSICQMVYFPVRQYTINEFIIANGCLYWLFTDYTVDANCGDEQRALFRRYRLTFHDNLRRALQEMRLAQEPSMDAVVALIVGASYAVETHQPTTAWLFTSIASHLAQTLGFHRLSTMQRDDPATKDAKIRLFWSIYVMDKSLSLRLGRASTIQDYDVTLPETFSNVIWIRISRIQGRIYEQLYSPAAMAQDHRVRTRHAQALAAEVHQVFVDCPTPSMVPQIYLKADEVIHFSTITLIYQAIPNPEPGRTFSSECITAARAALSRHQECMEMLDTSNHTVVSIYINCSVLYIPFAPFTVLFCHVIETLSESDLHRLRDFVMSLQAACANSSQVTRLHHFFQLFYTVAQMYYDHRKQNPSYTEPYSTPLQDPQENEQQSFLDEQTAADPAWPREADSNLDDSMVIPSGTQPFQLQNWYTISQDLLGLFETPYL